MNDVRPFEHMTAEYFRDLAVTRLQEGDAYGADRWAKGWVTSGGAEQLEPWLVHLGAALLDGRPRRAAHVAGTALRVWVATPHDRAALLWLRGVVVLDRLADPKTALLDLEPAAGLGLPAWLDDGSEELLARCRTAAQRSRKRVASVPPARAFDPDDPGRGEIRTHAAEPRTDGAAPDPRLLRVMASLGLPVQEPAAEPASPRPARRWRRQGRRG